MSVGADPRNRIEQDVTSNPIFLYMKGTPDFPMCGFSSQVVQVLQQLGVAYKSFDVLSDQAIREGVKQYSNWPTIPQLYVRGQFVGGCDIVLEMHRTGELETLLKQAPESA